MRLRTFIDGMKLSLFLNRFINFVEKNFIRRIAKLEKTVLMVVSAGNPFWNRNWIEWVLTFVVYFLVSIIFAMIFGGSVEGIELYRMALENPLIILGGFFWISSPGIARLIIRRKAIFRLVRKDFIGWGGSVLLIIIIAVFSWRPISKILWRPESWKIADEGRITAKKQGGDAGKDISPNTKSREQKLKELEAVEKYDGTRYLSGRIDSFFDERTTEEEREEIRRELTEAGVM